MNFESKIRQTISDSAKIIDKEQFINNLTEVRYNKKLKRSQAILGILDVCLILFFRAYSKVPSEPSLICNIIS